MKKLYSLIAIVGFGAICYATPVSTPAPANGFTTQPATPGSPSYRLVTKAGKLFDLSYTAGKTMTKNTIFCATTYAEIKTQATTLGITNLPPDPALPPSTNAP